MLILGDWLALGSGVLFAAAMNLLQTSTFHHTVEELKKQSFLYAFRTISWYTA